MMPQAKKKRNVLIPWLIGLAIVVVTDIWVATQIYSSACPAPGIARALVVIVIPSVYLALMFLTLKSQD